MSKKAIDEKRNVNYNFCALLKHYTDRISSLMNAEEPFSWNFKVNEGVTSVSELLMKEAFNYLAILDATKAHLEKAEIFDAPDINLASKEIAKSLYISFTGYGPIIQVILAGHTSSLVLAEIMDVYGKKALWTARIRSWCFYHLNFLLKIPQKTEDM